MGFQAAKQPIKRTEWNGMEWTRYTTVHDEIITIAYYFERETMIKKENLKKGAEKKSK